MPEKSEQKTPNACPVCGQGFNSESERSSHERTAHPTTGGGKQSPSGQPNGIDKDIDQDEEKIA
jgi:hypothetical protein